jgi:tRNA U34 5-methylaminomethyl-2-thiouridine-forming methyltransferase MnmC
MTEIILTEDGSHTLFIPELNEHYHSVHGAIQESNHIFINTGLDFCIVNPIRIFEVGFGTGLNALLSAIYSFTHDKQIFYTAIEKYPLNNEIINSLNYKGLVKDECRVYFDRIHKAEWNIPEKITNGFTLLKVKGDLSTDPIKGNYDLIYFDAFGPDKQPEMWTEDIFRKISEITVTGGIMVTYSVKGVVKRILQKTGFNIILLPGPPGKRLILRAVKK